MEEESQKKDQYGLPVAPNRPQRPDLQTLINAKAPVWVRNRAGVLLVINYRPSPGSVHGKPYPIPQTIAPFPIRLSQEQIQSAAELYYLVDQEKLELLWPDQVKQTEEDREEIKDAQLLALNPAALTTDYRWSPNRGDNDVEIIEDPEMAKRAAAVQQRSSRVMILAQEYGQGRRSPVKVLRELLQMSNQVSLQDMSTMLSVLNTGAEGEDKLRKWVLNKRAFLEHHNVQSASMASTPQRQSLESYERQQNAQAGVKPRRGRTIDIPEAQLRSTGRLSESVPDKSDD